MRPKSAVSRGRAADRAIDALGDGTRRADARVDRARVVVGVRIWLRAAAHPFRGAAQTVEVGVAYDGVDVADARDELGRDHLGTRAVLGLRREDEARIDSCISREARGRGDRPTRRAAFRGRR